MQEHNRTLYMILYLYQCSPIKKYIVNNLFDQQETMHRLLQRSIPRAGDSRVTQRYAQCRSSPTAHIPCAATQQRAQYSTEAPRTSPRPSLPPLPSIFTSEVPFPNYDYWIAALQYLSSFFLFFKLILSLPFPHFV